MLEDDPWTGSILEIARDRPVDDLGRRPPRREPLGERPARACDHGARRRGARRTAAPGRTRPLVVGARHGPRRDGTGRRCHVSVTAPCQLRELLCAVATGSRREGAAARARGRSRPRARRRRGAARQLLQAEDRLHHPLHLLLVGAAVAAHRLLHARRRVLESTRGRRTRPRRARLRAPARRRARCGRRRRRTTPPGRRHPGRAPLISSPTPSKIVRRRSSGALPRPGAPPPVAHRPEAPVAFVDDSVPASAVPGSMPRTFTERG